MSSVRHGRLGVSCGGLAALVALACSSGSVSGPDLGAGAGGASTSGTSGTATGGVSSGQGGSAGFTNANAGGLSAGGAATANAGTSGSGTPPSTSAGANNGGNAGTATAGANSGGVPNGNAGAPSGGSGGSSSGGTVTWTATDYVSRKWARWPIPNPASMNLPHPMSYADGTDGVTDTITGLVWQKTTNTATTTWQAALDYCSSLGTGWSLPTRIELTSILDTTQSGAKTNTLFKYATSAGWTWASTPWVVNSRKAVNPPLSWFINFSQGDSNNSLSQLAASAYSRCVKIPTSLTLPAEHYTTQNGEVKDNYTGLVWQQAHSGASVSLSADQASSYCSALALNGQTWRLPSLNELASSVDDVPSGNVSPAVDHTAFPATATDALYWTTSPYGTSTTEKWTLNFLDGFTSHRPLATLGIARCVR